MSRVSRRTFVTGAASLSLLPRSAAAADYPTQTVRIVVPFSAGSMTDLLARVIADKLAAALEQGSDRGEPAGTCRHLQRGQGERQTATR